MGAPAFHANFYVGTSEDGVVVDGAAVAVPTGYYYVAPFEGDTSSQLSNRLQAHVRNTAIDQGNFNCLFHHSNGYCELQCNGDTTLVFDDLSLLLGFDASLTGATVYGASRHPRYTWYPTKEPSYYPTSRNAVWAERSGTIIRRSADGTVYTSPKSSVYDTEIQFSLLPEADILAPSNGTSYRDFETFFTDAISAGAMIRYYPDRDHPSVCKVGVVGADGDEEVGSIQDFIARHLESYNGLWDISIPMLKAD